MILTFCFQVDLMRFFRSAVVAKPFGFSVDGHAGAPFVLKPNDAHKPRFISPIRFTDVLRVAVRKNISKIDNSIVRFVAVNVVNKPFRPIAVCVQPCQTMRFVHASRDADGNVPNPFFNASSNITSFDGFAGPRSPGKNTCVSVIIKRMFKLFNGQHHQAPPVMSMNVITPTIKAQA